MRVAVVGFGHLGNYHAQKVQGHSKAKLVGIVDPAEERQSFARSQGYEVITDWKSEISMQSSSRHLPIHMQSSVKRRSIQDCMSWSKNRLQPPPRKPGL